MSKEVTGISIGVSKETVMEAKGAILAILGSKQDQETIQTALEILGSVCRVNNTAVSGNTIEMKG